MAWQRGLISACTSTCVGVDNQPDTRGVALPGPKCLRPVVLLQSSGSRSCGRDKRCACSSGQSTSVWVTAGRTYRLSLCHMQPALSTAGLLLLSVYSDTETERAAQSHKPSDLPQHWACLPCSLVSHKPLQRSSACMPAHGSSPPQVWTLQHTPEATAAQSLARLHTRALQPSPAHCCAHCTR